MSIAYRRERAAMKVAIAVDGPMVAPHFGRCEGYVIAEIADGEIRSQERIGNPGHEPGRLPAMLNDCGVECIVAGGMGPRAIGLFETYGIAQITGVRGSVEETLSQLADGSLAGGESACHH
jgi:predicted Fe-Mo cluster-binding NifX family protein